MTQKRRNPILLRASRLFGFHVYALRRYRQEGQAVVASDKDDVTNDFLAIAAEQWPHLVKEGHIQVSTYSSKSGDPL